MYIWKEIDYTAPAVGQHYTAPVVTVRDDGTIVMMSSLISNTSGSGPYSVTQFFVGFDNFGNRFSDGTWKQTTIDSSTLPDASALAEFQANNHYDITFPAGSTTGAAFYTHYSSSDPSLGGAPSFATEQDVITPQNGGVSFVQSPTTNFVSFGSGVGAILDVAIASNATGEYGVMYLAGFNGNYQFNLLTYQADNSGAGSAGVGGLDSTPAAAAVAAPGGFVIAYESINGSNGHYLTFQSVDLDGSSNTNIGGGTGTFDLYATDFNGALDASLAVEDIREVKFAQLPNAGGGANQFLVASDELVGSSHYVDIRRVDPTTGNATFLYEQSFSVQSHVAVAVNKTDGTALVGFSDAGNGNAAIFEWVSTSGFVADSFNIQDSSLKFIDLESLNDGRYIATFEKTIDAGTQTTRDVAYILDTRSPGQFVVLPNSSTGQQHNVAGTSGSDFIEGSNTDFNYYAGSAGGDEFVITLAKYQSGVIDEFTDFDQGNSGRYSLSEGDYFGVTEITGGGSGGTVKVFDSGDKGTYLMVDADGTTGAIHYQKVGLLDGIHAGHAVKFEIDGGVFSTIGIDSNQGYAGNFNAGSDGNSDLIWVNDTSRAIKLFELNGHSSGSQIAANLSVGTLPTGWNISGIGDFNNDGNSDLLLRSDAGALKFWEMNGATVAHNLNAGSLPAGWHVKGTGDFNHDNISDVVLQNDTSGAVKLWEFNGHASGAQLLHNLNVANLPSNWGIVGVGDFNGDNNDDLLLRLDTGQIKVWEMTGNGSGAQILANLNVSNLTLDWHIEGIGDFNNDGKSDMLLVNDSGALKLWEMNGATIAHNLNAGTLTSTQHVAGTGDFNGDGFDDILLRYDNGQSHLLELTGAASGNQILHNLTVTTLDTGWATQNHHYDLV